MSSIDTNSAYKRCWALGKFYLDTSRARIAAKHGERLAQAWAHGRAGADGCGVN